MGDWKEPPVDEWGKDSAFWAAQALFIKQIAHDCHESKQVAGYYVNRKIGRVFSHVTVFGYVTCVDSRPRYTALVVEDGSGASIEAVLYLPFPDAAWGKIRRGTLVRVSGHLATFREALCVAALQIYVAKNPNEETLWAMQTLLGQKSAV